MPLTIDNPPPLGSPADEAVFAAARDATDNPPLGPQSLQRSGQPGRTLDFFFDDSRIHPDATRKVRVYVPAAYSDAEPANLIVFQDGNYYTSETFNAPVVIDNLIAEGSLPPTIGVFIEPGDLKNQRGGERANRSLEYDVLDDAYVRMVLEEVLPRVLVDLNVSLDPERRAVCGMSSGGIAAFTMAWHRPDQFRRVISHCGSFTNLRGGGVYPSMVRMSANKPLRVFLQSGNRDMNRIVGSWAVANHDMAAAFKLKGYDYRFEFGNGTHTLHHGAAIFPQTLRWIWREHASA